MATCLDLSLNSLSAVLIGPSRAFAVLLWGMYLGASLCLGLSQIAVAWQVVGWIVLSLAFYRYLCRYALCRSPYSVVGIRADEHKQWWLHTTLGQCVAARLLGDSFLCRYFLVLNFKCHRKWGIVSVVLFKDAVAPQAFRRLKGYLSTL